MAYYYFEPWGAPTEDDRWRLHSQLQWYGYAFKGEPPAFFDRDPEETARLEAEQRDSMSLEEKIVAYLDPRSTLTLDETPPA